MSESSDQPPAGADLVGSPSSAARSVLGFEPPPPVQQPDAAHPEVPAREVQPGEVQPGEVQPGEVQPGEVQPGERQNPDAPSTARSPHAPHWPAPARPPFVDRPGGVPPRPQPLPPPRGTAGATTVLAAPRAEARPGLTAPGARSLNRPRRARLVLRRIDPWSVFLYAVVASICLGVALIVAVGLLYGVLSMLGVLHSVNKLIGDVTAAPGSTGASSSFFTAGKVMTFTILIAALDVVLLTALATLGAFLYNLCAALTGGIEVTLSDQG